MDLKASKYGPEFEFDLKLHLPFFCVVHFTTCLGVCFDMRLRCDSDDHVVILDICY